MFLLVTLRFLNVDKRLRLAIAKLDSRSLRLKTITAFAFCRLLTDEVVC